MAGINPLAEFCYRQVSRKSAREFSRRPVFSLLRLETRTRCNGTCEFCPCSVKNETRPDQWMSEELYRKIVDELAEMSWSGGLSFYINNEPLLDPRLCDFLEYLQAKRLDVWTNVMTNGRVLTKKLGDRIMAAGVRVLKINDYSKDGRRSARLAEITSYLQERWPGQQVVLLPRDATAVLGNKSGTAPNKPSEVALRMPCRYPFLQLNVTANGNVGLCCYGDVHMDQPLGNAGEQSLLDIWQGPAYQHFRRAMLRGDRSVYDLCAKCDYKGYLSVPRGYGLLHRLARRLAPEVV
jgi:MoaA/NifB/PqqE/SkfB family radical SAM enzyme